MTNILKHPTQYWIFKKRSVYVLAKWFPQYHPSYLELEFCMQLWILMVQKQWGVDFDVIFWICSCLQDADLNLALVTVEVLAQKFLGKLHRPTVKELLILATITAMKTGAGIWPPRLRHNQSFSCQRSSQTVWRCLKSSSYTKKGFKWAPSLTRINVR